MSQFMSHLFVNVEMKLQVTSEQRQQRINNNSQNRENKIYALGILENKRVEKSFQEIWFPIPLKIQINSRKTECLTEN